MERIPRKFFAGSQLLIHDIDKLEMAFQAKFYQDKGISKEKLQTFFNTANERN